MKRGRNEGGGVIGTNYGSLMEGGGRNTGLAEQCSAKSKNKRGAYMGIRKKK